MAWATPPTFVSGAVLTAAQLNVLAADLNETFVAKATGLADFATSPPYGVATGTNAVAGRQAVSAFIPNAGTTTLGAVTSTLTDVGDPTVTQTGPQVTATTGTKALAFLEATVQNSNVNSTSTVIYAVDGVSDTSNLVSLTTAAANQQMTAGGVRMITGLTAGSHLFTMQYAITGSTTGTFSRRYITILPF